MREIKFRAWDSWWGKMYYFDFTKNIEATPDDELKGLWILHEEGSVYAIQDKIKIMQYTGLNDKNGVEIYEGDIITTDLERNYLIVEYRNGAFMLNCNDGLEDYYDIFFGTSEEPTEVYKYGEVIGNIHDNPELMGEGLIYRGAADSAGVLCRQDSLFVFGISLTMCAFSIRSKCHEPSSP